MVSAEAPTSLIEHGIDRSRIRYSRSCRLRRARPCTEAPGRSPPRRLRRFLRRGAPHPHRKRHGQARRRPRGRPIPKNRSIAASTRAVPPEGGSAPVTDPASPKARLARRRSSRRTSVRVMTAATEVTATPPPGRRNVRSSTVARRRPAHPRRWQARSQRTSCRGKAPLDASEDNAKLGCPQP